MLRGVTSISGGASEKIPLSGDLLYERDGGRHVVGVPSLRAFAEEAGVGRSLFTLLTLLAIVGVVTLLRRVLGARARAGDK